MAARRERVRWRSPLLLRHLPPPTTSWSSNDLKDWLKTSSAAKQTPLAGSQHSSRCGGAWVRFYFFAPSKESLLGCEEMWRCGRRPGWMVMAAAGCCRRYQARTARYVWIRGHLKPERILFRFKTWIFFFYIYVMEEFGHIEF